MAKWESIQKRPDKLLEVCGGYDRRKLPCLELMLTIAWYLQPADVFRLPCNARHDRCVKLHRLLCSCVPMINQPLSKCK